MCVCVCVCAHHYTIVFILYILHMFHKVIDIFTIGNNQCIMVVPTESVVYHTTVCDNGIYCGLHHRLLPSSARTTCTCEGLEKVYKGLIVVVGLNYTISDG